MFYSIVEDYILATQDMCVWDYLGIRQDSWCRIKKNGKLTLEQYKKLSLACDYRICDDQEELAQRMVEVYPWND